MTKLFENSFKCFTLTLNDGKTEDTPIHYCGWKKNINNHDDNDDEYIDIL